MIIPATLLFCLAGTVSAFSNGTLLPSYLCGAGIPDYTTGKVTSKDGFPKSLGAVLKLFKEKGSDLTVAGFHNSKTIEPQTNLVKIVLSATPNVRTIKAGQKVKLTVTPNIRGDKIIGLLLYTMMPSGAKIGSFAGSARPMMPFRGCGRGSTGIVHSEPLETTSYSGIVWTAPTTLKKGDLITFTGLAVTEKGFGFHMNNFTMT